MDPGIVFIQEEGDDTALGRKRREQEGEMGRRSAEAQSTEHRAQNAKLNTSVFWNGFFRSKSLK